VPPTDKLALATGGNAAAFAAVGAAVAAIAIAVLLLLFLMKRKKEPDLPEPSETIDDRSLEGDSTVGAEDDEFISEYGLSEGERHEASPGGDDIPVPRSEGSEEIGDYVSEYGMSEFDEEVKSPRQASDGDFE